MLELKEKDNQLCSHAQCISYSIVHNCHRNSMVEKNETNKFIPTILLLSLPLDLDLMTNIEF